MRFNILLTTIRKKSLKYFTKLRLFSKEAITDFEVNLKIKSIHGKGYKVRKKKFRPRSPVVRKTPLFPLGNHHKRPLLGNTTNDHFWGNTTNDQFLQDFSVQPFLNGTKIIVLLQYVEKSCRNWSFVVFPQKWSFVVFPQGK